MPQGYGFPQGRTPPAGVGDNAGPVRQAGRMITYPPYGYYPLHLADILQRIPMPTDWASPAGDRKAHFHVWRDGIVAKLAQDLWPEWRDGQWHGQAKARMHAMTMADLDLCDVLRPTYFSRIRAAAPHDKRHFELLPLEDEKIPAESLAFYSPALSREVAFDTTWQSGAFHKAGNVSTYLKSRLQRPRAYQAAMMLGRPFEHYWAKTANTAAMISGHAFQGLIGVASVFENLSTVREPTSAERIALEQLAVDIGDRRTLAGVHYPSDNLGSWIVALDMAAFVFRDAPAVRAFMAAAIGRSAVHAALRASGAPEFQPGLAWLERLRTAT